MKLLITLYLIVSFNSIAKAFTLNNTESITFAHDEVLVNVAKGNCSNIGINESELLTIIADAVDQYWNKVPTSRLKLRAGSILNLASINYSNGPICLTGTSCEPNSALAVASGVLITCNHLSANFSSSGVLAVTVPNNIDNKTIIGSLIMINDQAANPFVSKSRDEKIAIIAHELGHSFGLGHSNVRDSLMYFSTVKMRSSLGLDDIRGISYLYPKQQPVTCGAIQEFHQGATNFFTNWSGLFIGLFLVALLNFQLRYLKLRPRF